MKTLKTLTISKFLGIDQATIALNKPVLLVVGGNNAGKSSVLNALEFALRGTCRELPKKKDSVKLARHGAKDCKVSVEYGALKWSRTPSSCSVSESLLAGNFGDPERLRMVFRPKRFLEAAPAERAEIVATLTCDRDKLRAAALAAFLGAGLDRGAADAMSDAAAEDLDRAEKLAIENRRESKRARQEVVAPPAVVTIDGEEYDLGETPMAAIQKRLSEREAERKTIMDERDGLLEAHGEHKLGGTAEDIKARIESVDSELFKLGTPLDPAALDQLRMAALKGDGQIIEADKALAVAGAQHTAAGKRYKDAELLKDTCPCCGQSVTKDVLDRLLASICQEGERAQKTRKDAFAKVTQVKQAVEQTRQEHAAADAQRTRYNELNITLEGEKALLAKAEKGAEVEAQMAGVNDRLAEIEAALGKGRKLLDARRQHESALATAATAQKDSEEGARLADVWDRVVKECEAGGSLRKIAAAGFNMATVKDAATFMLTGREVRVEDDWSIYLGDQPSELLSASEKWRLSACFAAALAEASGLGLLVLDGAEVLDDEQRKSMVEWLEEIKDKFGTIVVGATTKARPAAEWLACWEVVDGKVTEVEPAQPAERT